MSNIDYANWNEINRLAVVNKGGYACYVDVGSGEFGTLVNEVRKRYPLDDEHHIWLGAIVEGGLFFFDTKEELDKFYTMFEMSGMSGSGIYTCAYSPDREKIAENA